MEVVPHPVAEDAAKKEDPAPKEVVKLEAGQRIFDRFTLTSILGEGRGSISWLADDPRFRREVVLKIFSPAEGSSVDAERTAWRELLRRLRVLNHPNVSMSMEFFNEGSRIAVSNQYVEGKTLATLTFLANKILSLPEQDAILKAVGLALVVAHEKCRVIHGNLNAFNILLTKGDRRAKITDFGFHPPALFDPENKDPNLPWKRTCVSPERLAGGSSSIADDIYAFSAIAFQLFTGSNLPVDSAGVVDHSRAEDLLKAAPDIWREKLLDNLSPDSEKRSKSMESLLEEVKLFEASPVVNPDATKAHYRGSSKRKHSRRTKSTGVLQRKRNRLTRLLIIFCAIAMPLVLGLTIRQNMITSRALELERTKAEPLERAAEMARRAKMAELDAGLVAGDDPSTWKIRQREAAARTPEPKATPKPTPFSVNSAVNSLYKEGQKKFAAGDAAGALESYGMAMVLQSDWVDLLDARAVAMMADDQAENAVEEYNKILSLKPSRSSALLGRAKANLLLGKNDAAKADLEAFLKLQPENAEARAELEKLTPTIPKG